MKNIPQKIYLQTGHKNQVTDFNMLSLDDITWSSTRENDTDIEYDLSNLSVLHSINRWALVSEKPTKYGKYFVRRKDGKVHWETWNGSGWAYNGNSITHWSEIVLPCD